MDSFFLEKVDRYVRRRVCTKKGMYEEGYVRRRLCTKKGMCPGRIGHSFVGYEKGFYKDG